MENIEQSLTHNEPRLAWKRFRDPYHEMFFGWRRDSFLRLTAPPAF